MLRSYGGFPPRSSIVPPLQELHHRPPAHNNGGAESSEHRAYSVKKKKPKQMKENAPMLVCSPDMPGRSPRTCPYRTRFDPYMSETL